MNFLMGLNDSFSHTRGQILMMDPMPTINRVFSLVAQEEKQKTISVDQHSSSVAFVAKSNQNNRNNNQNKKFNTNQKDHPYCTNCKF